MKLRTDVLKTNNEIEQREVAERIKELSSRRVAPALESSKAWLLELRQYYFSLVKK